MAEGQPEHPASPLRAAPEGGDRERDIPTQLNREAPPAQSGPDALDPLGLRVSQPQSPREATEPTSTDSFAENRSGVRQRFGQFVKNTGVGALDKLGLRQAWEGRKVVRAEKREGAGLSHNESGFRAQSRALPEAQWQIDVARRRDAQERAREDQAIANAQDPHLREIFERRAAERRQEFGRQIGALEQRRAAVEERQQGYRREIEAARARIEAVRTEYRNRADARILEVRERYDYDNKLARRDAFQTELETRRASVATTRNQISRYVEALASGALSRRDKREVRRFLKTLQRDAALEEQELARTEGCYNQAREQVAAIDKKTRTWERFKTDYGLDGTAATRRVPERPTPPVPARASRVAAPAAPEAAPQVNPASANPEPVAPPVIPEAVRVERERAIESLRRAQELFRNLTTSDGPLTGEQLQTITETRQALSVFTARTLSERRVLTIGYHLDQAIQLTGVLLQGPGNQSGENLKELAGLISRNLDQTLYHSGNQQRRAPQQRRPA